jgi:acetylornithine deacetylase/succinyl-diaminopimelate desuccinylase-like protein
VLPSITTGATDLRSFRQLGITAYGFSPILLSREEHLSMHSVNERISVEAFTEGMEATCDVVRELAKQSTKE